MARYVRHKVKLLMTNTALSPVGVWVGRGWRLAGAILLAAGCATASLPEQVGRPAADAKRPGTPGSAEGAEYRLQRGDALDVKFFHTTELNESVTVRPDGRIALQLIGEVDAAGLTAEQLARMLRERYAGTLRNPEISVLVRKFSGQKAYVGGEVNSPGLVSFDAPPTLLQALIQVGWLKASAEPRNVAIIRNAGAEVPAVLFVDVKKLVEQPGNGAEVTLQPFDVVYVPKSTVAKVGDFVDQYLDKIILTPISRLMGFSYVYQLNGVRLTQ
jgi:polysaccharide export outer membrane protein